MDDGRSGRDGHNGWEPPIPVGQLLRESLVSCAFWLGVILVFSLLGFSRILATKLELPPMIHVPLGIVAGVAAWWLIMIGFAKGWIDDDA